MGQPGLAKNGTIIHPVRRTKQRQDEGIDTHPQRVDIETIEQLKARYVRGVDTKDWEALAATFAPDTRSFYSGGKDSFEGREAIMDFLHGALGHTDLATQHPAHTPEIELPSETAARGTWYMEDFVIAPSAGGEDMPAGTLLHGSGIYADEWRKEGGEWKLSLTGWERIFEDVQPRNPASSLKTRWDPNDSRVPLLRRPRQGQRSPAAAKGRGRTAKPAAQRDSSNSRRYRTGKWFSKTASSISAPCAFIRRITLRATAPRQKLEKTSW